MLRSPRFSRYSDSELAAIRKVVDYRETAATTSFGPYVIRYARDHLDDPRVPRALHRLVFATRHACRYWQAPGKISQAAYALAARTLPRQRVGGQDALLVRSARLRERRLSLVDLTRVRSRQTLALPRQDYETATPDIVPNRDLMTSRSVASAGATMSPERTR